VKKQGESWFRTGIEPFRQGRFAQWAVGKPPCWKCPVAFPRFESRSLAGGNCPAVGCEGEPGPRPAHLGTAGRVPSRGSRAHQGPLRERPEKGRNPHLSRHGLRAKAPLFRARGPLPAGRPSSILPAGTWVKPRCAEFQGRKNHSRLRVSGSEGWASVQGEATLCPGAFPDGRSG